MSWAPMLAQIIGVSLHSLWCYIYIGKMNLAVYGAGLSMITTYILEWFIVTAIMLCVPGIRKAMFWPTSSALKNWKEYLSISLPVTLMICAECWAFEILIFAAGIAGVKI